MSLNWERRNWSRWFLKKTPKKQRGSFRCKISPICAVAIGAILVIIYKSAGHAGFILGFFCARDDPDFYFLKISPTRALENCFSKPFMKYGPNLNILMGQFSSGTRYIRYFLLCFQLSHISTTINNSEKNPFVKKILRRAGKRKNHPPLLRIGINIPTIMPLRVLGTARTVARDFDTNILIQTGRINTAMDYIILQ